MQKKVELQHPLQAYSDLQELPKKNQQKEDKPLQALDLPDISIFCALCKDYLVHSVTTGCQHTFCELCLNEYTLFLDECPECKQKIRHLRQVNNILLDNLILDYIKQFEPEDCEEYERRLDQYKQYKKKRNVGTLETGALVDIRDLDYVWCSGRVHRTINKFHDRKVKYVLVKYDKSTKKEELPETSPRLAPKGFFTEREDIPHYERGKLILRNAQQGKNYHLIPVSDSESEEEEKKDDV